MPEKVKERKIFQIELWWKTINHESNVFAVAFNGQKYNILFLYFKLLVQRLGLSGKNLILINIISKSHSKNS